MEFSSLLEIFKLRATFWFSALLVLGFLSLAPDAAIHALGLADFLKTNRAWVSLGFVVSAGVLVSTFLNSLWQLFKSDIKWHLILGKRHKATLQDLSPEEKQVLASYLIANTKTQHASPGNGVFSGLEAAKVIFRSSTIASSWMTFPYNIQPWAWAFIQKEPELVGLSKDEVVALRKEPPGA